MWFDLAAVPLAFAESSPHHIENVIDIAAPPDVVFAILADGDLAPRWFADIEAVEWLSQPPHGQGSEREVELRTMRVKERFLAWEPGRRIAFHVFAMSLPFAKAMLEDLRLEPLGEARTRFTWRVHYRPSLLMRLVHPVGRVVFGRMFRSAIQGLARLAEERAAV